MLWGTYRSGAYVGLRTRSPRGLLAGAAWFDPDRAESESAAAAASGESPPSLPLRHDAQERDGLRTFGWTRHDGESFGTQLLADSGAALTITWLKRPIVGVAGGDWALRVEGGVDGVATSAHAAATARAAADATPPPPPLTRRVSVLLYIGDEGAAGGEGSGIELLPGGDDDGAAFTTLAAGADATIGGWRLALAGPHPPSLRHVGHATLALHNVSAWLTADLTEGAGGVPSRSRARRPLPRSLPNTVDPASTLAAFQVTAELPFAYDFVFVGGLEKPVRREGATRRGWRRGDSPDDGAPAAPPSTVGAPASPYPARVAALSGTALTVAADAAATAFDARFDETFGTAIRRDATLPPTTHALARAALSNLLGGLAYFYGAPLVRVAPGPGGTRRGASGPLFTAVPARAFFPRGFLWDEGFHQLIVARWSRPIARDVLAHWADAVTASGWIPREQILGEEAEARVPPEFVPQSPDGANPPTLLLPLADMARRCAAAREAGDVDARGVAASDAADECAFLSAAYPRVKAWIDWLLTTQVGPVPSSFAWRGRDPGAGGGRELNPKTLTSGLDDYPRSSHPHPAHDRHVDLAAWAALATRLLTTLGRGAGARAGEVRGYEAKAAAVGAPSSLAALHWHPGGASSPPGFYDYGLHTDAVRLAWHHVAGGAGVPVARALLRAVDTETDPPTPRHVTSARGAVGLFPLLLRLLPPDSPHLAACLDLVDELACAAGVASLSPRAALRDARNTEHDAPYWRGAAWPPITYMTAAALDHYARAGGAHAARAAALRDRVRAAFVTNAAVRAAAAGGVCDVWERYDGGVDGGEGLGPRPFTGWGATVVLAAAGAWFEL